MHDEREAVEAYVRASGNRSDSLTVLTTIGLMVIDKWDKADKKHNGIATARQAISYDDFSQREADDFAVEAKSLLRDYAASIGVEKVSKTTKEWWWDVWTGVVSAWAYALSLILIALVFRVFGSDIFSALEWVAGIHHS